MEKETNGTDAKRGPVAMMLGEALLRRIDVMTWEAEARKEIDKQMQTFTDDICAKLGKLHDEKFPHLTPDEVAMNCRMSGEIFFRVEPTKEKPCEESEAGPGDSSVTSGDTN